MAKCPNCEKEISFFGSFLSTITHNFLRNLFRTYKKICACPYCGSEYVISTGSNLIPSLCFIAIYIPLVLLLKDSKDWIKAGIFPVLLIVYSYIWWKFVKLEKF